MQFSVGRPDIVRAIHQRWLLKFWTRSCTGQTIPSWQAVESEDLSRVATNLSYLDVTGSNDASRFQIFSHGTTIGQVYGSADCRGRYLDEVLPANAPRNTLAPFHQTVKGGCPVYTVQDITDGKGRIVHFERLLLPFTHQGAAVGRILASFEFISADGAFESRNLMKTQTAPPALRLSAQIAAAAMA